MNLPSSFAPSFRVSQAPRTRSRIPLLLLGLALWMGLIGRGVLELTRFSVTPAANESEAPVRWPQDSQLQPSLDQPTLVLFLHPKCSCSHATVAELAKLQARLQGRLRLYVLVVPLRSGSASRSSLWQEAARIPSVQVLEDLDAAESKRFHAFSSGRVLLFSSAGERLFSGGITPARGHGGDNLGSQAIEEIVRTGESKINTTDVFGCALFSTYPVRGLNGSWSN